MSPHKNNSDKVSASQGQIWLGTIKMAVEQAGGHGARIEEGECDTFLSAHQLLNFCHIAATRPEGCAAGYLIDLIPNHHQLPHLLRDNITVLNGQVVHVSVWFHPETPPKPVLESIRKAFKLDGPAADDAEPALPETPNQEDPADSVGASDMRTSEAEASEFSLVTNGYDEGISSDTESVSDGVDGWDRITDLDLHGYDKDNSMFSIPAPK